MRDLIEAIRAVVPADRVLPLATIAAHRTGGRPDARGREWSGAFAVSLDLWGEAPESLRDQIVQANEILDDIWRTSTVGSHRWRLPDDFEQIHAMESETEAGDVLPNSAELGRAIERAGATSIAWDRPIEVRDAIAGLAGPLSFVDLVTTMTRPPSGAWEHHRQADSLVRLHPELWNAREAARSGMSKAAIAALSVLTLGAAGVVAYLIVKD